jgi:hypothetical protein
MISEFFSNLINYDSKLFSTVRGLYFPGYLTNQYLAKKRVPYLTPIRLFVFLMFALFAVMSIKGFDDLTINVNDAENGALITEESDPPIQTDKRKYSLLEMTSPDAKTMGLLESLKIDIETRIAQYEKAQKLQEIQASLANNPKVTEQAKNQIEKVQKKLKAVSLDGLNKAKDLTNEIQSVMQIDSEKTMPLTIYFDHKLDIKIKDLNLLSEDQILEKYNVNHWFERILTKQLIKFNKDSAAFGRFLFQNLTWAIFLEVLLMALVFKLFYLRQKRMYVEHFIYHLHTRSFLFINITLLILIPFELPLWFLLGSIVLLIAYLFMSIIKVYQQSIFMSLVKSFIFLLFDFFILLFSIILVMIISSLLY